jgi:hypothetical protein
VVDLYVELANESPSEVSAFISPFCDTLQFVGSTHIDVSPWARPVYIPVNSPILVSGKFCLSFQVTPGTKVSIAQNQFGEPLIKVIIVYE